MTEADVIKLLLGVLGALVGWLWQHSEKQHDRAQERLTSALEAVANVDKRVSDLSTHMAENYVRGHEIAEVKRIVESLRSDMQQQVKDLRVELSAQIRSLVDAVNAASLKK
jgi:molybdopterin converting factor small subunit